MEPHVRAHIRFDTTKEVANFVGELNSDGSINKYFVENFNGSCRVDARSFLGVLYMFSEYNDNLFLVNDTEDGKFPFFIDKYRP